MLKESVSAGAVVWVLINNDQLAAYLVFDQLFEVSQVLAVGVDPKCQRRGLARGLLEQYMGAQRNLGITEVLLDRQLAVFSNYFWQLASKLSESSRTPVFTCAKPSKV